MLITLIEKNSKLYSDINQQASSFYIKENSIQMPIKVYILNTNIKDIDSIEVGDTLECKSITFEEFIIEA